MKEKPKMYIVRKYTKATSAAQAIRKDKSTPVHDVWVDDSWKTDHLASAIGFDDRNIAEDD
jgi:hypothetical protein